MGCANLMLVRFDHTPKDEKALAILHGIATNISAGLHEIDRAGAAPRSLAKAAVRLAIQVDVD